MEKEKEIREKDKLFVGGLPFEMENDQLKELFSEYGEIKSCFVAKNKGYGFVKFSLPEEAEKAKEALDEKEYQGRVLKVDFALPKKK